MAQFHVQAKDVIYRIGDLPTINGIQNFSWDPTFNEEYLQELGNVAYVDTSIEPEISGSFDSTSTGSAYALLSKMIYTRDGSGGFTGYLYNGVTPNTGTIKPADLEFAIFDLIGPKKIDGVWSRTEFFPRVFLSSIAFAGDAAGNATETYNFEGQLAEVYRTPSHDIITKPATYTSATSVTLVDTAFFLDTETGEVSVGGAPTHTFIAALIDDQVYDDTFVADINDAAGAGPAVISFSGLTVPVGARVSILVYANTPGAFPTVVNPVSANFIRANSIDIWLVDPATVDIDALADGALMTQAFNASDFFLRVQSFDMNIDLRREALRQIKKQAGSSIYYRSSTYPLNITANASTFESDLDAWRRIIGEPATVTNAFADKLDLAKFTGKTFQLVARYYYNNTPIQTLAFIDATVTGMGSSTGVGGRTEVNWSFTGSNFRLEGDDV